MQKSKLSFDLWRNIEVSIKVDEWDVDQTFDQKSGGLSVVDVESSFDDAFDELREVDTQFEEFLQKIVEDKTKLHAHYQLGKLKAFVETLVIPNRLTISAIGYNRCLHVDGRAFFSDYQAAGDARDHICEEPIEEEDGSLTYNGDPILFIKLLSVSTLLDASGTDDSEFEGWIWQLDEGTPLN